MKIDFAIHSSDANPMYLDFWPVVSEVWKTKFNVTPILVFIDEDDVEINSSFGIVIKLKPIKGIPIHLQTQIVRFWITILYPEKISIISDIDMIPISTYYFINSISAIEENDYVHLNPCIESYGRLPACYHIAKGSVFKSTLEIDDEWELFIKRLLADENNLMAYGDKREAWFADELYSTNKILTYSGRTRIQLLTRKNGQNGYRIDRLMWVYYWNLLKYDYYYDLHSIRPYSNNAHEINKIRRAVINAKHTPPPYLLRNLFEIFHAFRYRLSLLKKKLSA